MKKAFTLAEVLISLTLIGIIASLTIPVVQRNAQKEAFEAGLKKAYVVILDAQDLAVADKGPTSSWPMTDADTETIFSYYSKHFNLTKYCFNTAGCWTKGTINGLNKQPSPGFYSNSGYGSPTTSFKLNDGTNWSFDLSPNEIMQFIVDLNGDKGPNTVGKDIFFFVDKLDGQGFLPQGTGLSGDGTCTSGGTGFDCAGKIFREDGKINY